MTDHKVDSVLGSGREVDKVTELVQLARARDGSSARHPLRADPLTGLMDRVSYSVNLNNALSQGSGGGRAQGGAGDDMTRQGDNTSWLGASPDPRGLSDPPNRSAFHHVASNLPVITMSDPRTTHVRDVYLPIFCVNHGPIYDHIKIIKLSCVRTA